MKPIIAITPDVGQTVPSPSRPALERYELKRCYADAIVQAGALPLIIPFFSPDSVDQLIGSIDGLVVSGGAFDIPSDFYSSSPSSHMGPTKPERSSFERALLDKTLKAQIPVLGICGGMQLLNVVLGGTLFQDIRQELPQAMNHEQSFSPATPAHDVVITEGTRLFEISQGRSIPANTTHHQAINRVGSGLIVAGRSSDGVIEAIESPVGSPYILGVQWHPELLDDEFNRQIYSQFVESCQ